MTQVALKQQSLLLRNPDFLGLQHLLPRYRAMAQQMDRLQQHLTVEQARTNIVGQMVS
jgi:hypothetical protein